MKKTPIILYFLFLTQTLWGQAWTIYTKNNSPLPYNVIHSISIDNKNTKWIGTDFGLAQFDDHTWKIYNTSNSPLLDNSIRSLAIEKDTIWIGSFQGGLYKFDGTNWTLYNNLNSPLSENFIRSIAVDTSGVKWIGTGGAGLFRFDGHNWTKYDMSNTPSMRSNYITSIAIEPHTNRLWAGTINGGLIELYHGNMNVYTEINSPIADNTVLGISIDENNAKWLASPAAGLMILTATNNWYYYNIVNSAISTNTLNNVIAQGGKGHIISKDNGLLLFNGFWQYFNTSNSPLPENYLQAIAVDKNNIIWLGTASSGLVAFNPILLYSSVESYKEIALSAFPNPAKDWLYIEGIENGDILSIISPLGSTVLQKTIVDKEPLKIETIPSGMYWLHIRRNSLQKYILISIYK